MDRFAKLAFKGANTLKEVLIMYIYANNNFKKMEIYYDKIKFH